MAAIHKHPGSSTSSASGRGSCRADEPQFPAGLRVLVVDDDLACLRILGHMLQRCQYRVTTCCQATMALSLLRERKCGFDLVISDVYMPDMDGYKLLELVGLEMDLPVIMMSADGSTSAVMRGIKHGACDYLIKPIRIEELKTIWQHVIRKRWNENKVLEHLGSLEESNCFRQVVDDDECASSVNDGKDGTWKSQKKKRDANEDEDDIVQDNEDPSTSKKPRVIWSMELHQQFVTAVNQLGIDKAVPKRVLELMNVPGLTRENIASHLQKFRLYLKRLSNVTQLQSELNSFCGSIEPNTELSSLDRINFQALAASGQIPPEVILALHTELLGQPSGNIVVPDLSLQASTRGTKSIPLEQEITYGQPLLKCLFNNSKQFPMFNIAVEDMSSGFSTCSFKPSSETANVSDLGMMKNNKHDNLMVQMLQQQHQSPLLQESHHATNVQPSCIVVPSQTSNFFQMGNSPCPVNKNANITSQLSIWNNQFPLIQNSDYVKSSMLRDNSLVSNRSNNMELAVNQVPDQRLKYAGFLYECLFPGSVSPSASCSSVLKGSISHLTKKLALHVGLANKLPAQMPIMCTQGNDPMPGRLHDSGQGKNLGFVDKGSCFSNQFADDIEYPAVNIGHMNMWIDNSTNTMKQESQLDFMDNSEVEKTCPSLFLPSDYNGILPK